MAQTIKVVFGLNPNSGNAEACKGVLPTEKKDFDDWLHVPVHVIWPGRC